MSEVDLLTRFYEALARKDAEAVIAGRLAFEAGRMPRRLTASASSPMVGMVGK